MIEVEIKARIKNIEEVRKKVVEAGAIFVKREEQTDAVFGHPSMLDENKMVVEGGYIARIREADEKIELTFKEIVRKKGKIEIGSNIGSIEIGKSFLNRLGFEEAFVVHKFRDIFKLDDFEIALDDVDLLGEFIEVEKIVNTEEKAIETRRGCSRILDNLEINYEIIDKGYGDLMQKIINGQK
ncbi:MAG TPA: class IV adenylate cyclase [Candidatus Moranbacteria bacterium]|nr:class IV adenylate cyclase [Candidatus Moranbacteria bacterium]